MLVDEICRQVLPIAGDHFAADVRVGIGYTAVALEDGRCGLAFTLHEKEYESCSVLAEAGTLVGRKASELIAKDRHDFIVVYNEDYDSTMHREGTEAKGALQALRFQVEGFEALANGIKKHWTRHNTLLTFSTDHGVHDARLFRLTLGDHGKQMPEDINIVHFLGVIPRKEQPAQPN